MIQDERGKRRYATGFRYGYGAVEAVVRPGSLVELWRLLHVLVAADRVIIMQAANTGLTGGSTPDGAYDRGVVLVSVLRLKGIHLVNGGAQAICFPGATLDELEEVLKPIGREPHSVIGSSCIGASVIGGICNNSGGALVRRGPAYTELAIFARVSAAGDIELVNHIGLQLGNDPETILRRLEEGAFTAADVDQSLARKASDCDYHCRVRDVDAPTPARFNADPLRLFEASGSAGRTLVFAVRLDTFPREPETQTFYVGTNDPAELTGLRRALLTQAAHLPVSAEYIHRDAFDVAEYFGKDVYLAIRWLGVQRLPRLFAAKTRIDSIAKRLRILPKAFADRCLQAVSRALPQHLPKRMRVFRDRFEHHLILQAAGPGLAETRQLLAETLTADSSDFFECTPDEAHSAFLHRFATASAAIRYHLVHGDKVEEIVALDVALRRNDTDWFESLPRSVSRSIVKAIYHGHFLCHVLHQDYLVTKGTEPEAFEHEMLRLMKARGAECPAEHNVGHVYTAKPSLVAHYQQLDPGNRFNPGIGKASRAAGWR